MLGVTKIYTLQLNNMEHVSCIEYSCIIDIYMYIYIYISDWLVPSSYSLFPFGYSLLVEEPAKGGRPPEEAPGMGEGAFREGPGKPEP